MFLVSSVSLILGSRSGNGLSKFGNFHRTKLCLIYFLNNFVFFFFFGKREKKYMTVFCFTIFYDEIADVTVIYFVLYTYIMLFKYLPYK